MEKKPIYLSRKFGIVLFDAIAGLLAIWVTYLVSDQDLAQHILATYGLVQPVVFALVYGIAKEDSAAIAAGTHPAQGDSR